MAHTNTKPAMTAQNDDYAIMGKANLPNSVYVNFLRQNNPKISHRYARSLVQTYRSECEQEGVRMDIAFAQMCHETGFLTYTRKVKAAQNNFAGIGISEEYITPGYSFSTMREGVRFHIQHLKAYASTKPTRNKCIDNRRKYVELGCAPTVFGLTGKWALSNPHYGENIADLVDRIHLSAKSL